MKAVVLAAGEGTRLRPLTEDKPKGMVEVSGKPILTHCFEQLAELGADELILVVGYLKQNIIENYGDEFEGIPITYAHQREQNGLAHTLLGSTRLVQLSSTHVTWFSRQTAASMKLARLSIC